MKAFTLLEAVVSMALASLLLVVIFTIFAWGSTSFQLGMKRQDIQSAAERILVLIRKDFAQAAEGSVSVVKRISTLGGATVQRDGACLNGLSNWRDPVLFDAVSGLPLYDRYIAYYATDQTMGQLIRLEIDPGGGAAGPWTGFDQSLMSAPPPTGPPVVRAAVLTTQLWELDFQPGPPPTANLKLRGRAEGVGQSDRNELLELRLVLAPRNSQP